MEGKTVIAVCGKGGVGQTVFSGALVRILHEKGFSVLAVDADPAMGLSFILGLEAEIKTLGNVKNDLIGTARTKRDPNEVANETDYLVLEALIETEKYSFLAMGRSLTRGCFCPVNTLLKKSVKILADNYKYVLVDAEAGVEQINREVMSSMDNIVALMDGSRRSFHSMELIQEMVRDMQMNTRVGVVLNRWKESDHEDIVKRLSTSGTLFWGLVPEDETLRRNDELGKSIFDLPSNSPVLESVREIAEYL